MVTDAPMSQVLKKEYDVPITTLIAAGTEIEILYDTGFRLEPDIDQLTNDAGAIPTSVTKFKDRIKLKFDVDIPAGKKIRLKIKPRRMV